MFKMSLKKFSNNWLLVAIITVLFASAKGDSDFESDIGDTVFIIGGVVLLVICVTCFCICRCARKRQIRKDNERIVTIHMPQYQPPHQSAHGISTVSGQTGSYPYPAQEYVIIRPEHPLPSYTRSHPFYEEPPPSYFEVAGSTNPTTTSQPFDHTSNVNPS